MKKFLFIVLSSALICMCIPLLSISALTDYSLSDGSQADNTQGDGDTISVYIADEDKTEDMDFREYIIGVVAAEMPVEFHEEALSAGACAAATLARIRMSEEKDASLKGAVISTDPKKHQAYMTKEEMAEKWNGDFDSYYEKLCRAVDKAIDYTITYNGKPIVPVYHAISPGKTEAAENVWGGSVPYLVSVDSVGDTLCEKYLSLTALTFDEFSLAMQNEGCSFPEDITLWIGEGSYTESGTLKEIEIGGKSFTGEELREIFSLRSAAITLDLTKNGIEITVKGYGHGVGMSQYGADYLARQGYGWQEILCHYYTGVEVELM